MIFSVKKLSYAEIKIAEQEDDKACHDGSMLFILYKYRYTLNTSAPRPRNLSHSHEDEEYNFLKYEGVFEKPEILYSKDDFIMPHGGYYAVLKECIAKKIPWEVLLNAEPYLSRLKEADNTKEDHEDVASTIIRRVCEDFPDYFNREDLQAGFTWEELKNINDIPTEPMELFKIGEADLIKNHPDHYEEYKKHCEHKQQEWDRLYKSRLEAKQQALEAIYLAAEKFFLENDELPPKPQKGAGEAWQKG
ncbi:MAG: hypothetical protein K6G50_02185 [bacterium]|nr:hypothetical protein [bacterium]